MGIQNLRFARFSLIVIHMNLRNCFLLLLAASVLGGTLMPVHTHAHIDPCSNSEHRCGEDSSNEDASLVNHDCHRCPTCSGTLIRLDFQADVAVCLAKSERIPESHSDPAADVIIDGPPQPPRG